MDFKETYEVCALLEGSANAIRNVRANNMLDMSDLFALMPLVDLGKEALKDSNKIVSEFRGTSGEGMEAVIARLVSATLDFVSEVSNLVKLVGGKA